MPSMQGHFRPSIERPIADWKHSSRKRLTTVQTVSHPQNPAEYHSHIMRTLRFFPILFLAVSLSACQSEEATKNVDPNQASTESADATLEQGVRPVTAEKLDLNTTPTEVFLTIPGVGERMAHEFEEYRPYISIVEFRKEMAKYVDEETIAGYEDHVYVPIDINASDAETVAQILGLDLEGAEELVASRPYASQDAFIAKVTEVAGGISSQFARLYLASE